MRFSIRVAGILASLMMASTSAILSAQTGDAAPSIDMAEQFGAREMVTNASLSPDGTKLVYLSPTRGQGVAVMVADLVPTPQDAAGGLPGRW